MNNNQKNNYIWNTIAGIINASEAVILLAVVTRTNGVYDAGILTIAFAIANLMVTVGKFGMRSYQVTDVNDHYDFNTYFTSRIITSLFMFITIVFYVLYGYRYKEYTIEKTYIILFIGLIFVSEAFEDVFAGLYQKNGRLDVGGIIFSIRWFFILFSYIILLVLTNNLFISTFISSILSVICCIILLYSTYRHIAVHRIKLQFKGVISLLYCCTPLFLSAFLQFYMINVSKYAIDDFLTEDVQACYGFVAMPVFVIGLLNSFMYQPVLVQIATQWKNNDYKGFLKRIWSQLGIILLITIICLIGAYLIGIPVLSVLYNTNLANYKNELLILLLGGGFLAIVGFFTVLLTTMRKQQWILIGYSFVSIIAFVFTGRVVQLFGVMGAAVSFAVLEGILSMLFAIVVFTSYYLINGKPTGCIIDDI